MRIYSGFIIFFVVASFSSNGQTLPGSIYSAYGFGDLHERSSAYTRAMGNTSIAVRGDYNINATNPASLTAIVAPYSSMFEIGNYYGSTYINSYSGSNSSKYGGLSGINYWFRLSKKWASLVGISPVSNNNYSAETTRVLGGTSPILVPRIGTGGLNQFYFNNAFDLFKNFSIGASASFYLGSVKRTDQVPATGVSPAIFPEQWLTSSGANIDFGAQYVIPIKKTSIILGATYDHGASLYGHNQTYITNLTRDTLKAGIKKVMNTRLPPVYGGGISIKRKLMTIAADVRYTDWTKAVGDQVYLYQRNIKTSVGLELGGDFSSFSYLKTISYRAGAWYENYPIIIENTKLNMWGYTVGAAFPIGGNRATIALNYYFNQLGLAKGDLIREQARYLSLDIIVRDRWAPKRKFD